MPRYKLRTLLILLAVLPPLLAVGWWQWPTVRDAIWPPTPPPPMKLTPKPKLVVPYTSVAPDVTTAP